MQVTITHVLQAYGKITWPYKMLECKPYKKVLKYTVTIHTDLVIMSGMWRNKKSLATTGAESPKMANLVMTVFAFLWA